MYPLISLLKTRLFAVLALATSLVLVGCGGGGGGGGTGGSGFTRLKVEDANIYGALVQDKNRVIGVPIANGIYEFRNPNGVPMVPTLPITIKSQNWIVNGKVIPIKKNDAAWYSTKLNEIDMPLTFQDLDNDGRYTQVVDIPYNGEFVLNYAPSGTSLIYANPVAALIPANWNGVDAIAGLSKEILQAATTSGIKASNNADLNKVTSLLVALTEALVLTGQPNVNSIFTEIANNTATINLLDLTTSSALPTLVNNIYPGTGTLVTNLQDILNKNSLSNPEALVKAVQNAIAIDNLTDLGNITSEVLVADSIISTAKSNVALGNTLADKISSLRIVPFCDLPGSGCDSVTYDPWKVFGRLTNFSISLDSNSGTINLVGGSDWFLGWFGANSIALPYSSTSSISSSQPSWSYTHNSASAEILINQTLILPGDLNPTPGNFLKICSSQNTCIPYFLATDVGICSLVKSFSPPTDNQLLAQINLLQSASHQVSCP